MLPVVCRPRGLRFHRKRYCFGFSSGIGFAGFNGFDGAGAGSPFFSAPLSDSGAFGSSGRMGLRGSMSVVKNYLRNTFDKLGVWSRLELALYVASHGGAHWVEELGIQRETQELAAVVAHSV